MCIEYNSLLLYIRDIYFKKTLSTFWNVRKNIVQSHVKVSCECVDEYVYKYKFE